MECMFQLCAGLESLLLNHFDTEMTILHKVSKDDIEAVVGSKIAGNIISAREGKMHIVEGGGGVYGKVE